MRSSSVGSKSGSAKFTTRAMGVIQTSRPRTEALGAYSESMICIASSQ